MKGAACQWCDHTFWCDLCGLCETCFSFTGVDSRDGGCACFDVIEAGAWYLVVKPKRERSMSKKKERENTMQIRLSEDEFVLYHSAAEHKGISLSAWARLALGECAMRDLERAKRAGLVGEGEGEGKGIES